MWANQMTGLMLSLRIINSKSRLVTTQLPCILNFPVQCGWIRLLNQYRFLGYQVVNRTYQCFRQSSTFPSSQIVLSKRVGRLTYGRNSCPSLSFKLVVTHEGCFVASCASHYSFSNLETIAALFFVWNQETLKEMGLMYRTCIKM